MAITVKKKKNQSYYKVTNKFEDSDTTLGFKQKLEPLYTGIREQIQVPLKHKNVQDPYKFKWDGVVHVLDRGASETLREGIVKHLVGDWDLEDIALWEKDQRRVLNFQGFIPKLEIVRLETPEEKEEKDARAKATSRYIRPDIGVAKAEKPKKEPEVIEEEEGFEVEEIEKAEKKKPGRPKKEAD